MMRVYPPVSITNPSSQYIQVKLQPRQQMIVKLEGEGFFGSTVVDCGLMSCHEVKSRPGIVEYNYCAKYDDFNDFETLLGHIVVRTGLGTSVLIVSQCAPGKKYKSVTAFDPSESLVMITPEQILDVVLQRGQHKVPWEYAFISNGAMSLEMFDRDFQDEYLLDTLSFRMNADSIEKLYTTQDGIYQVGRLLFFAGHGFNGKWLDVVLKVRQKRAYLFRQAISPKESLKGPEVDKEPIVEDVSLKPLVGATLDSGCKVIMVQAGYE